MSNRSIQDSLSLINTFLEPVRAQAQKEASFKDTKDATPQEQMKEKDPAESQTNLGVEQTQAANDSGSTVSSAPDNKEGAGNTFAETQGTQTLTTDDPVEQKGNIGPVKKTEINSEQKVARAENLGNAILEVLFKAASESAEAPVESVKAPTALDKMAAQAAEAAQEYYEGYLYGMHKRAKDQQDLQAACAENKIDPALIEKAGGISGILDKVAMEFPEAILPEEAALPAAAAEMEDGAAVEEEGGDATIDALADALDEAGVTADELAQAVEDVQALQEAGISPDELAEVMSEVLEESGDEAAAPIAE